MQRKDKFAYLAIGAFALVQFAIAADFPTKYVYNPDTKQRDAVLKSSAVQSAISTARMQSDSALRNYTTIDRAVLRRQATFGGMSTGAIVSTGIISAPSFTTNATGLVKTRNIFNTAANSTLRIVPITSSNATGTGPLISLNIDPDATLSNTRTASLQTFARIAPVYNQATGTASNTDLMINRTETAVGSGSQRLISAGSGGASYVEKFGVSNTGELTTTNIPTVTGSTSSGGSLAISSSSNSTKGYIYFDGSTRLNYFDEALQVWQHVKTLATTAVNYVVSLVNPVRTRFAQIGQSFSFTNTAGTQYVGASISAIQNQMSSPRMSTALIFVNMTGGLPREGLRISGATLSTKQTDTGTTDVIEMRRTERTSTGTAGVGFGLKTTTYLPIAGASGPISETETKISSTTIAKEGTSVTMRNYQAGALREVFTVAAQPFFYRYLTGAVSTPQAAGQFILKKGVGTIVDGVGPRVAFQSDDNTGTQYVVGALSFPTDFTNSRSSVAFQVRGSSTDTFADTEAFRGTYDKRLGVATTTPRGGFDTYSGAGGSKVKAYFGSATNYAVIDQDLGYRAKGNTTTWNDLRIEPTARTGAGIGTAPSFAATPWDSLLFGYDFANSGGEYLYFNVQMPHAWLEGSDVYPHVHFAPHTTGTGQVDFVIRCSWATPMTGTFTTGTEYTDSYNITSNSQYKHLIASNATPQSMAGMALSAAAACRITRSSTDTYAGDVSVLYIDIHHEIDSMGSDTEYSKTATP